MTQNKVLVCAVLLTCAGAGGVIGWFGPMEKHANGILGLLANISFLPMIFGFISGPFVLVSLPRIIPPRKWPAVKGKILSCEVQSKLSGGSGARKHRYRYYFPAISFEYEVDGQTYKSDTPGPEILRSHKEEMAREICDRYPEGSEATVFYKPGNPERAIIEQIYLKISDIVFLSILCFGLSFLVFFIISIIR